MHQWLRVVCVLLVLSSSVARAMGESNYALRITHYALNPAPVKKGSPPPPMPDAMVMECVPQSVATLIVAETRPPRMTGTSALGQGGIDVSHYQGHIQWNAVARDPQAGYAYIKATESATWQDDTYRRNIREARAAGIKVGAYHFFSPTTAPLEQFANMTSLVKLQDQDLVPMIDVEKVGRAGSANLRHRLNIFLQAVEKHYGVRPIIYTGYNFYRKHLAGHFSGYKFMIACYTEQQPPLESLDATVLMWQYTASGRIDGIRGACDCSAFVGGHKLQEIMLSR